MSSPEKIFRINDVNRQRKTQTVVTSGMGIIMWSKRDQINVIAESFGSQAINISQVELNIVPPIPKKELKKFGQALVDYAKTLDDTPPEPRYLIM